MCQYVVSGGVCERRIGDYALSSVVRDDVIAGSTAVELFLDFEKAVNAYGW